LLTLPIKRRWFDLIEAGIKTEEYRDIKPYYDVRFHSIGTDAVIRLRAGYSRTAPTLECQVSIRKGTSRPEWGAVAGIKYYVLTINKILKVNL
jgi:hypothetical protein